ncbi:MAG: hypothetical protein QGH15_15055 [Kiritimatiellia bacterium]|jgi:hypothetical protein|nr:hypothetical protein [Kiritimatiellia bacterium]
MRDDLFEINAEGVDTEAIVAEIRKTVAEKTEQGVYADARIARAERSNLMNLRDEEGFLAFYLDCLKDAVFVDISDFEIHERRPCFGRLLVILKTTIWKLLKFYTYRLWSQQNQVNGLLLSAVESTESKYRDRIEALERRIDELEKRGGGKSSEES